MTSVPVILYGYDPSPFCKKIDNILALKKIPHERVTISPVLPRPELADYLGVKYRRSPVLAIGNDVYCDTSAITVALERRFPPLQGYGTIFPRAKHGGGKHNGLLKAFARSYAEGVIFASVIPMIPWESFPEAVIKDRSSLLGGDIDVKAMAASRSIVESAVSSHLALVEEQLSDGREWLFETDSPSLADISVHFILAWTRDFLGIEALFKKEQNPFVIQWIDRLSLLLKEQISQNISTSLDGRDAATKILSSTHESYDVIGFDSIEATRLGVSNGDIVEITPEDNGRTHPTTGKLVALNREELSLEVTAPEGLIRCHFPRLGFSVKLKE